MLDSQQPVEHYQQSEGSLESADIHLCHSSIIQKEST